MENASKALIIAGAILISIVLVSVGVLVVNSLNTDDALSTMTQQEIQAFNTKFDNSTGLNRTGAVVRTLISTIITNNSQYAGDTEKTVKVTMGSNSEVTDAATLSTMRNSVNNGKRYNVTAGYSASGTINSITITEATATTN